MIYKLIKYPFFGKYMVKWRNPLSEDEMKEWERIDVKSKSGATVKGFYSSIENAKATIVLGHPMGKEAKGYFLKRGYPELLKNNGYNVIVFDINGFGESNHGSFSFFEDIIAIGKKAKELQPNIPVGYHGISLGAQWATIAFADETHPYNFAIIESTATTLLEFWNQYPTPYKALRFLNLLLPKYRKKIEMIERIKEATNLQSILYIYSKSDELIPYEMGERFHKNTSIPSELWSVPNAKHAAIMKSESKDAYQDKIIDYFDESVKDYLSSSDF